MLDNPKEYKSNEQMTSPQYSKVVKKSGKYKSHEKISNKKPKISKFLIYLIGSAILAGGIKASTLGIKHINEHLVQNNLSESQEDLKYMIDNGMLDTELNENNELEILNAEVNNLLKRYYEDRTSVTQEEIKTLLKNCYSTGRNVIFSKVGNAIDKYNSENSDNQINASSDSNFIYREGLPKHGFSYGCGIATRDYSGDVPMDVIIIDDNKSVSDYVRQQLKIEALSEQGNFDTAQSILLLSKGIEDVNKFATADFEFEHTLLGKKFNITFPEIDNEKLANNSEHSNLSNDSTIQSNIDRNDSSELER